VTATEFALAPATLEVPAGQPVEITFINKGATFHNWAVPSLAATRLQVLSMPKDLPDVYIHDMTKLIKDGHPIIAAGPHQRAVLRFTPLDVGTYQILCTIPGHKEMGMVGTLVVPVSHREPGAAGGIRSHGQGADRGRAGGQDGAR
jgi:plastocyanin